MHCCLCLLIVISVHKQVFVHFLVIIPLISVLLLLIVVMCMGRMPMKVSMQQREIKWQLQLISHHLLMCSMACNHYSINKNGNNQNHLSIKLS
jgi:hypothetical protein